MSPVPANRYLTFFSLAIAGCLADLLTKSWIFNKLGMPPSETLWVWEPYFGLQTSLNRGALFGMGQGMVPVFALLAMVAAIGIIYWLFVARAAHDWLLTITLGLVSGGIFGNLYDRLGLWTVPGMPEEKVQAVRDWILWQYPPHVWPNFNIADSLLVCGAAMMLLHSFLHPNQTPIQTSGDSAKSSI